VTRGHVEQWSVRIDEQGAVIHLSAPTISDGSLDVPQELFQELLEAVTAWKRAHDARG